MPDVTRGADTTAETGTTDAMGATGTTDATGTTNTTGGSIGTADGTTPTGVTPSGTTATGVTAESPPTVVPSAAGPLLPHDEAGELSRRLQHAVTGFVDAPRASVEEADRVLEEIAARLTDAVAWRRRTLRTSWQGNGEGTSAGAGEDGAAHGTDTDTEQLRLALRDYRELADRLTRA